MWKCSRLYRDKFKCLCWSSERCGCVRVYQVVPKLTAKKSNQIWTPQQFIWHWTQPVILFTHTLSFKHTRTLTTCLSLTCKKPGFQTVTVRGHSSSFLPSVCQSALRLRLFLWESCQWIYGSGLYPLRFLRVSTLISLRAGRVDTDHSQTLKWSRQSECQP